MMRRVVVWQPWEGFGSEHLEFSEDDSGVRAVGTLIRIWPDGPHCVAYDIRCDRTWHLIGADVVLRGTEQRRLRIDNLHGCSDLDIAACAFTNTMPIRRLGLAIGESQTLSVAFVSIPNLGVESAPQRYTRLSESRYRYEGLSTAFTADISVDDAGVVIDYPRLCRRVWPQE